MKATASASQPTVGIIFLTMDLRRPSCRGGGTRWVKARQVTAAVGASPFRC